MRPKPRVFRLVAGLAAFACLALVTLSAQAATYYVRTDGGTAAQCNGTANVPVSAAPNCAWSTPTIPLPLGNNEYGGVIPKALIQSGDTLVIGSGSYMVGWGAPGSGLPGTICQNGSNYDCVIGSIPSGIDSAHPTVITGDCSAPPELWASGSANGVIWLRNVHDIKIACLSITDHSTCIVGYGPTATTGGVTACTKNSPTQPFGMDGMQVIGVSGLTLDHVNIHGMAQYGMTAGAFSGTNTFTNLTLRGNGMGGWNGDLSGVINAPNSSNSGLLVFNNLVVAWNGCTEAYPTTTIVGCWGQTNGGYGDGFGTARTGGDWVFNNATFMQNTQDGLDMLYHTLGGSITINGGMFSGNQGQQIKVAGNVTIQNAAVNGYCNNFAQYPTGGAGGNQSGDCRAGGGAITMQQNAPNQTSLIQYSTITGDGDVLLGGNGSDGASNGGTAYTPNSTNVWRYVNNIVLGQPSYVRPGQQAAFDWHSDGAFSGTVQYIGNLVWNTRNTTCDGTGVICKDPQLQNETLAGFSWNLLPSSPAINNANPAYWVPVDYYGTPRPLGGGYDIGAVEYRGQAWLGGDNPPVPKSGGTQPASGAPSRQPDAPVARVPASAQPGNGAGSLMQPEERWSPRPGDQRFGNTVNPRDARVIRADWRQDVAPGGTAPAGTASEAPVAANATPARAAEVAKPAAAPARAPQAAPRTYWVVLVNWFQDFYHRFAVR